MTKKKVAIIENAYPNGWECQECETVYVNEMPFNCDDGTVCKNCSMKVEK